MHGQPHIRLNSRLGLSESRQERLKDRKPPLTATQNHTQFFGYPLLKPITMLTALTGVNKFINTKTGSVHVT